MITAQDLRQPGTVFLDHSSGLLGERRHLMFANPLEIVKADRVSEVPGALERVTRHVEAGRYAAGFLAYEAAGAWIDAGLEQAGDSPAVWFGIYEDPVRPDVGQVERLFSGVLSGVSSGVASGVSSDVLSGHVSGGAADPALSAAPMLTIPDAEYTRAVEDVRRLIGEGDVYQVNYTGRFEAPFGGDPLALYGRLRSRQPVEYGAFIHCGDHHVLSLSPELFFRRSGTMIETRPMKGTVPRGRTREEDAALVAWLRSDPKSLAENLMIVDLLRNDLSVVCETGSVKVPDLYRVETYPTLHQMISRVTGRLRPGIDPAELLGALFPCGSVTGAPKRRAMRRIRELETGPRGVYCGAIGFMSPDESVFSVAIRTAVLRGGRLRLGAGSGIVWDSDPEEELAEARLKTAFFTDPALPAADSERSRGATGGFSLIETMLVDDGRVRLLDTHLDRAMYSARSFGWMLDRSKLADELDRQLEQLDSGRHRLRLLIGPDGIESVQTQSIDPAGESTAELRIGLARTEVHSGNPFLKHKTTRRDVYDRAQREAGERGLDEVVLSNERGELTEGAVTNVFLKLDGSWYTPAPAAGLLPGVARAVFMDAVGAAERTLAPQDLRRADEIVLTNAVHGARRAVLEG